ncbi:DUF2865 domain-containing protein [Agrobacterium sp. 22-222-1]
MRQLLIAISVINVLLFAGLPTASADSCAAIDNRMRAATSASNSKAVEIRRQIAALRVIERQRSCTAEKIAAGGFFNACRGLVRQREDAERALADIDRSMNTDSRAKSQFRAMGCEAALAPRNVEQLPKPGIALNSAAQYARYARYYCVRPSDGYFFPAPNSQFGGNGYAKIAVVQCRFICEDESIQLYVLADPELESVKMTSVKTGAPYEELATAFRYQNERFKTCDWSRYFNRIDKLRAQAEGPEKVKNALVPTSALNVEDLNSMLGSAMNADADTAHVKRKIRIVGPAFLPEESSDFLRSQ